MSSPVSARTELSYWVWVSRKRRVVFASVPGVQETCPEPPVPLGTVTRPPVPGTSMIPGSEGPGPALPALPVPPCGWPMPPVQPAPARQERKSARYRTSQHRRTS